MTDAAFQLPIVNIADQGKRKLIKIALNDLPANEYLLSPAPTRELIEDISVRGQTTPIQVTLDDNDKYIVIAGRRRVKAIRLLHEAMPDQWKTVDAIVIDAPLDTRSILGLSSVENNLRTDNPLTDLQAIQYLIKNNPQISEPEIARQTGIPIARIRKRLKLNKLIPEINQAVINNDININVAEDIAKLSPGKQQQLYNSFLQKGKITKEDVVDVQRTAVQENVNTLPDFPAVEEEAVEEILGYIIVSPDLVIYRKPDESNSSILALEEVQALFKNNDSNWKICKVVINQ